jgi:hypothetical protein
VEAVDPPAPSHATQIAWGRYEPAHAQAIRAPGFADHTVWTGTYTCYQGLTGVTISLDTKGRDVTAVFEFAAVPSNPTVPSGASRLIGTFDEQADGTFHLVLEPGEWISQPSGWFLVGVDARTSLDGGEMHGTIDGNGCGAIDLERRDQH